MFGEILATRLKLDPGSAGRTLVQSALILPQDGNFSVIGDLASCVDANGRQVPGLAPAAIQQGKYVARLLRERIRGCHSPAFAYHDRGEIAAMGRNRAEARLPRFSASG